MYASISKLRQVLFGIGVAVSLGFGTTQALAAPKPAGASTLHCNPAACNRICQEYGYDGGVCLAHNKQCVCY